VQERRVQITRRLTFNLTYFIFLFLFLDYSEYDDTQFHLAIIQMNLTGEYQMIEKLLDKMAAEPDISNMSTYEFAALQRGTQCKMNCSVFEIF